MFVKTVSNGEVSRLTDYKNIERTSEVNTGRTLAFTLIKTDKNQHAYNHVENENIIIYRGVEYVIKRVNANMVGKKPMKVIKCELKAYSDLINGWQYQTISGSLSINTAMDHALKDTGFTFSIHGEFKSVESSNFGNDNPLSLISSIIKKYRCEIIVGANNHIGVYNQIGQKTNGQFRYRYNIGTISMEIDTESFTTYCRGFGKDGLETYHESPLAAIYGRIHAEPVIDDRFTNKDSLKAECEARVDDEFRVAIEIDYIEVVKNGTNINPFNLGDSLYLIHNELELKSEVRVLAITDYPESNKQPKLKISNITRDARDMLSDLNATKKTVDKVTTDGQINNTALSADAQYTIDSVNRTFTEVDYLENGLRLTDPVNFMEYLLLKRGGIYATKDEGLNLHNLISPNGINLTYGYGLLSGSQVTVNANTTFAAGYDPSTKADANHNHDDRYYTETEIDNMLNNTAGAGHTHAFSEITNKPLTYPPETHNHGWEEITGKPTEYPAAQHGHLWSEITEKPTAYPPEAHNHDDVYYTQEQINTMQAVEAWAAPTMQNGWVAYGPEWSQPGYYKDRERVYLRGNIAAGTTETAAFTLPLEYRPPTNESHAGIDVMSTGEVIIRGADNTKISLDTISFRIL